MNDEITGWACGISGGRHRGWPGAAPQPRARKPGQHRPRSRYCRPGFLRFRRRAAPSSRRACSRMGGHGADRGPRSCPGRMERGGGLREPPAGGGAARASRGGQRAGSSPRGLTRASCRQARWNPASGTAPETRSTGQAGGQVERGL